MRGGVALASGDFDAEDLRVFGLIAAYGGVSAASRHFGISKATLSRSLARLEAVAGSPLFDRVARGLRLTPLGEMLRPAADAAVEAAREAEETLRRATGAPSGPLRIAASALTGQQLLAPVLASLAHAYPEIKTTLRVTSRGPDPLAENLDVVLRVGRPSAPYLITRRIVSAVLCLYVHHSLQDGVDLDDPDAIEGLGRVLIDVSSVPSEWVLRDEDRTVRMVAPPLLSVGDPTVALGVLRTGAGVAFLPDVYGDVLVRSGELVRALPRWRGPDIEIYASLPPRRASVPAVRVFLDALAAHVGRVTS